MHAPPPPPLTERQDATLRAIVAHVQTHGHAPTLSELRREIGLSFARTRVLLAALERKGWIARRRVDGRTLARAITVRQTP